MSYYVPQEHVVHKHILVNPQTQGPLIPTRRIEMPSDAKIIHVAMQATVLCLWEYHNATFPKPSYGRDFLIALTGDPIPGNYLILDHITTFTTGSYVYHVFEVSDQSENMEPPEDDS